MSNLEHIIQAQQPLLAALQKAEKGEITVPDLKPLSSILGILPQRNNLLATRIRITGGEISTTKFLFLADLAGRIKPGYIHLTSRQNFQFHDVTPGNAATLISECTSHGLPFRGGGGDSLRNVAITTSSGIAPDKSADLRPFAEYLTGIIFDWDDAFKLPRKLKIAFASAGDKNLALRQDLGFVETYDGDGRLGFTVYGGGGFGRNAAVAVKLLEFITPADLPRAARAMVELFSEHGDRQNRAVARIRYIAARLGEEDFTNLYLNYYRKNSGAPYLAIPQFNKSWNLRCSAPSGKIMISKLEDDSPKFKRWRQFAVSANRFPGESSVTLFVPGGTLKVKEFQKIAKLLKKFNIAGVRLTIEQNIFIPTLPNVLLPDFYAALKKLPFDLTFATFKKQLDCCIGSTVCKAGILDTPKYAALISKTLDNYFTKHPGRFTAKRANEIIRSIHISGCHNSCVCQQAVRFGFQGTRKRIDGVMTDGFTIWRNPDFAPIGKEEPEFIPAKEMPNFTLALLKDAKLI